MAPTAERVRELLSYDPGTGLFRWKARTARKIKIGDVAGGKDANGYVLIRVDGRKYLAHRLAFLTVTGRFPTHEIDHVNGNRADNSWANLREATHQQNCRNKRGLSAVKGVNRLPNGKWRAIITVSGRGIHLGCFDGIEAAHTAYVHAARQLFGDFARTTRE